MYFAPIMIDIKNRFGHILKERCLVMRGKEEGGGLSLEFRMEHENRKLPIRLDVRGKSDTRAKAARWKHTSLSAHIHEDVRLGDTGYHCFLYRDHHNVDPTEFDTEEEFAAEVGAYLEECVIVNYDEDDFAVGDEIALTYLALVDMFAPEPPPFRIEKKGEGEMLTIVDAEGKVLTFTYYPGRDLEIAVNGEVVKRLSGELAQHDIEEVLGDHFTTDYDLKHR